MIGLQRKMHLIYALLVTDSALMFEVTQLFHAATRKAQL